MKRSTLAILVAALDGPAHDMAVSVLKAEYVPERGRAGRCSRRRVAGTYRLVCAMRCWLAMDSCAASAAWDVAEDDVHLDHIKPWSLGGDHSPANLRVAHSACNISRGARVQ